jgi:hypothetical protein
MQFRPTRAPLLWALLALGFASPARAVYVSIEHNLVDGVPDTSYEDRILTLQSALDVNNNIVLNDPTPLPALVGKASVDLSTTFSSYNPASNRATFSGGSFSLSFDYNGVAGYGIVGLVRQMHFEVFVDAPTYSRIEGFGSFKATSLTLPGSNAWPSGLGISEFDQLTIVLPGQDLTGFDWTTDVFEDVESIYVLAPIPEPTTFALCTIGVVFGIARAMRRHSGHPA